MDVVRRRREDDLDDDNNDDIIKLTNLISVFYFPFSHFVSSYKKDMYLSEKTSEGMVRRQGYKMNSLFNYYYLVTNNFGQRQKYFRYHEPFLS